MNGGDKLIFDLSQEVSGSPNVFVRKSWLNILDNMNTNYGSNQSIIDTSQLSNSNRYMSYREAYILVPMMLTLSTTTGTFTPDTQQNADDYAVGLKNWYGSVVHSFTLDYNGTTIIQQTPFINMWNTFKLLTSLSWNDVATQGSTIGFYPDDPLTWTYNTIAQATPNGTGVCNNTTIPNVPVNQNQDFFNAYQSGYGNIGYYNRIQFINFDPDGIPNQANNASTAPYTALLPVAGVNQLWKSYIYNKVNNAVGGILQIAVSATIYLKHLHSFFQMTPLLKGVFMKMTLTLNNCSSTVNVVGTAAAVPVTTAVTLLNSSVPVGGVLPIMFSSGNAQSGGAQCGAVTVTGAVAPYLLTLQVGGRALLNSVSNFAGYLPSPCAQSIYLYVPAYDFNPIFEQSYLASPIKQINYTDVYQYQVLNVAGGGAGQFNSLLTNGIANVKSVLIIPFYSASSTNNTQLPQGIPVYQSPFDTAGCGTTSPLCLLTNFNVVVSGQNAIYNTQVRSFEQFNNQLYGCNAVNGGMTDGLTSGLFNSLGFENNYCYYYVNVSRMLPVEESVPKSIQIIGTNTSNVALDLFCFIEYGVSVSVDILSGARV